jgi:hypothetical protein
MNYSKRLQLCFTVFLSMLLASQTLAFTPTSFQLKSAPNKEIRHVQAIRLLEYFLRTEVDSIWSNAKFLHQISIEQNDPTGNTISKWMKYTFEIMFLKKNNIIL